MLKADPKCLRGQTVLRLPPELSSLSDVLNSHCYSNTTLAASSSRCLIMCTQGIHVLASGWEGRIPSTPEEPQTTATCGPALVDQSCSQSVLYSAAKVSHVSPITMQCLHFSTCARMPSSICLWSKILPCQHCAKILLESSPARR